MEEQVIRKNKKPHLIINIEITKILKNSKLKWRKKTFFLFDFSRRKKQQKKYNNRKKSLKCRFRVKFQTNIKINSGKQKEITK